MSRTVISLYLPGALCQLVQDPAAAFCGPGMFIRKAIVGARSIARTPATGVCLLDARPGGNECGVHVHVVRQVHQIGQVAVLAEELREGDPLPRRGRVELVRRAENDDHVTAAVRMQRVDCRRRCAAPPSA